MLRNAFLFDEGPSEATDTREAATPGRLVPAKAMATVSLSEIRRGFAFAIAHIVVGDYSRRTPTVLERRVCAVSSPARLRLTTIIPALLR